MGRHAHLKLPTLYGFINITASKGQTRVNVPCNTLATVCVMPPRTTVTTGTTGTTGTSIHPARTGTALNRAGRGFVTLVLDGTPVSAVVDGLHLCAAEPVGCGAGGVDRVLRVR